MTTSEQARADAMADAETLRLNAYLAAMPCWRTVLRISIQQNRDFAYEDGRYAADRAFRAVPGLRG
jgi:hypothetical protein